MWRSCCQRRQTWWSDSGSPPSTVHWSSWHLAWPPWPRTDCRWPKLRRDRAPQQQIHWVSSSCGHFTKLWLYMNGSSWVLVAHVSKDGQLGLTRLHVHRSTRVLIVISYSCVAARLRSAVVHWKRKMLTRDKEENLGSKLIKVLELNQE